MKKSSLIIVIGLLVIAGISWFYYGGGKQWIVDSVGGWEDYADEALTQEENSTQFDQDTTYHNDYFGISYTVPQGWWQYALDSDNMVLVANRQSTSEYEKMMVTSYEGNDIFDLISVGSLQYSTESKHLAVALRGERMEGVTTLDDFAEFFDSYMLEPDENGTTWDLDEAKPIEINGRAWAYRLFSVNQAEAPYYTLGLLTPLKDDYFLIAIVTYWPENTNAVTLAIDHLEQYLAIQ